MGGERIIFFDGVCNLCNGAVQFIIKRDPKAKFKFAPLQSTQAEQILTEELRDTLDSIVFYDKGKEYTKSTAALHIAKELSGPWRLFLVFKILPKRFRDWVYDLIAKKRYKWFGKRDSCMLPTPELKNRFL